jgi:hypothetical protein
MNLVTVFVAYAVVSLVAVATLDTAALRLADYRACVRCVGRGVHVGLAIVSLDVDVEASETYLPIYPFRYSRCRTFRCPS